MIDMRKDDSTIANASNRAPEHRQPEPETSGSGMSKSMHDGVEVWCDCCSCEAEPYWVEAMQHEEETGRRDKERS